MCVRIVRVVGVERGGRGGKVWGRARWLFQLRVHIRLLLGGARGWSGDVPTMVTRPIAPVRIARGEGGGDAGSRKPVAVQQTTATAGFRRLSRRCCHCRCCVCSEVCGRGVRCAHGDLRGLRVRPMADLAGDLDVGADGAAAVGARLRAPAARPHVVPRPHGVASHRDLAQPCTRDPAARRRLAQVLEVAGDEAARAQEAVAACAAQSVAPTKKG